MESFYAKMSGKLLGNGILKTSRHGKVSLSFRQLPEDVDWLLYCYRQLKNDLPLIAPRLENKTHLVYAEEDPLLHRLYETWYENKRKIIPLHFLEEHFTAESLAWWYQDRGHLKKKKNGTLEKIILSTEEWTDEERALLQYVLNLKFGLLFAIDGQKRLILYEQLQINYFLTLVHPWMQPCMIRKMKTVSVIKPIAKRTTISLPTSIALEKPTTEINQTIENWHQTVTPVPNHYRRWIQQRVETNDTKSYQIQLSRENQQQLSSLQTQTGLQISEIVQEAFLQEKIEKHPELHHLHELTTTQQAIMMGSILGDGSLRKRPASTYKTPYYENSCEEQRPYREWKVRKLQPFLYFPGKKPYIASRSHPLWMTLEEHFYAQDRIKRIPHHLLKAINDPHFLLALYLDDGSLMISYRVNHRKQKIYILPHIAIYLQNFKQEELLEFIN